MAAAPKPTPFEVRNKAGQTAITVYPRSRGGFVFRYYVGGKSRTVERVDREDAISEARRIAAGIDAGLAQTGDLTAADMESFVHARSVLSTDDPPLHAVVAEWKAARNLLGPDVSLLQLARQWADLHPAHGSPRTVSEVLVEMIDAKKKGRRQIDPHYLRNLRESLEKFAAVCGDTPIPQVREPAILEYLNGLKIGGRTRQNIRANIIQLFRFAQKRKYLAHDRKTEAELVEREHIVRTAKSVLTPEELRTYLAHVRPAYLPWMVLVAFSGVRSEEVAGDPEDPAQEQLAWSDIVWEERQIYVRPEVGKTDEGRYVPIDANLMLWLMQWRDRRGLILPKGSRIKDETYRLGKVTRIKWQQNCLRHSFGSYWLALHRDLGLGTLTTYMGNSVDVNRRNYQNPRRRDQAEAWFAIRPPDASGRVVVPAQFAERLA